MNAVHCDQLIDGVRIAVATAGCISPRVVRVGSRVEDTPTVQYEHRVRVANVNYVLTDGPGCPWHGR